MITKQAKWFAELPPSEQEAILRKFAIQNKNLFNSLINYEYAERS